ncbi:MAG TPA: VanZ family protein [Tenuifilaceae bacterium]|nr:VanZ family protein [Tenuifilaceae bacterium]HPN22257.1 VanZ family protein [Tenuifilaceae bacterium]
MRKQSNVGWILLVALVVMWILMIQVVPRFLPFDFKRVDVVGVSIHSDYLVHVLLFFALVLLVKFLHLKIKLSVLIILMLLVAIIAEVIQIYIPQRTFNYFDLISNVFGVLLGFVFWFFGEKVLKRKKVIKGYN